MGQLLNSKTFGRQRPGKTKSCPANPPRLCLAWLTTFCNTSRTHTKCVAIPSGVSYVKGMQINK